MNTAPSATLKTNASSRTAMFNEYGR
jgi:hypothetical protein